MTQALVRFVPAPRSTMDRNGLELAHLTRGQAGYLTDGQRRVCSAVRLDSTLFATTDLVSKKDQQLASFGKQDLHVIRSRADLTQFISRYEAFKSHG